MWQNYANKPSKKGKKRAQKKRTRGFHIRRVSAQISEPTSNEEIIAARVILNDFKPPSISIYSTSPMMPGVDIRLTLLQPKTFYCRCRVHSCTDLSKDSRVISESPYHYKIVLLLLIDSELEKKRILKYWKHIQESHLYPMIESAKPKAA